MQLSQLGQACVGRVRLGGSRSPKRSNGKLQSKYGDKTVWVNTRYTTARQRKPGEKQRFSHGLAARELYSLKGATVPGTITLPSPLETQPLHSIMRSCAPPWNARCAGCPLPNTHATSVLLRAVTPWPLSPRWPPSKCGCRGARSAHLTSLRPVAALFCRK